MPREDEYTKPHAGCREPGRWTAPDAYSTECEVTELVAAFVRALQPDYVIETGTAFGYTAKAIGEALLRNGQGRLDTLEIDDNKIIEARARCDGLPVNVVACSSLDFTPAQPVGFAWFDSLIGLRVAEFNRYRPWLDGAVVGFHDTFHGTLRSDLLAHPGLRPLFLPTPRGVCFAQVL